MRRAHVIRVLLRVFLSVLGRLVSVVIDMESWVRCVRCVSGL